MIAKNKKGKSFGGCVRYVLNEGHEILAAEGVLAEDAASIIRDFAIQRSGRPEIKQPVGHIAVAFSPEDSAKMTNEFMLKLAHEYMDAMGIRNTQYVIVRHNNTGHEHFHIVYNRIDNDLKVISVNNDYKRNIKVCKQLKDKYKLTYGKGKGNVNRSKLTGTDKIKYQIHDEIAANLSKCASYADLEKRLRQAGISIQYKYRGGAEESPENVQGLSFKKNGTAFKGSEIDRKFSHANLLKTFEENRKAQEQVQEKQQIPADFDLSKYLPDPPKSAGKPAQSQAAEPPKQIENQRQTAQESVPKPQEQPKSVRKNPTIGGVELTDEQDKTLRNGGHIYLENINRKDGSGKFSAYVFLNDEKKKTFFSNENPDKMMEYGGITIRLRDRILVERGEISKAKMKWWGGIDHQYPFVWKDPQSGEVKYSFADPRIPKEQHAKEMKEFDRRIQRNIPPPKKKGPKISR